MAHIAQVYINSPSPSLDREFHYSVPEKYAGRVVPGMRVKVPFGNGDRQMEAYVTGLLEDTDYPHLKDIVRPIDEEPVLTAEAIELCRYISKYCFCTFVSAVHLFLPPGLEMKFLESVYLTDAADTEVDQMVLDFPIMADYAVICDGDLLIYASHGHVCGKENPPPGARGGVLLCGHTHIPACEDTDGMLYLNPGSVSIPKDGSRHSYMTYENGEFVWKDLLSGEEYMRREAR